MLPPPPLLLLLLLLRLLLLLAFGGLPHTVKGCFLARAGMPRPNALLQRTGFACPSGRECRKAMPR